MIPGETGYFDGDGNPMTRAARLTMSKIVPIIPDLLLVTFFAAVATVPWLPWWSRRFSLRTLLLACTAVAVVLGLIVWLAHR